MAVMQCEDKDHAFKRGREEFGESAALRVVSTSAWRAANPDSNDKA